MVRSNFGGELSKISMTYLRVSGNASGSVNLPMPIKAAPTTKRRYGLRNPANLKITDFENFSTSGFIQVPQIISHIKRGSVPGRRLGLYRKQRACLIARPE